MSRSVLLSSLLAVSVLTVGATGAAAGDPSQRNQILAEIHQVQTGDYTYQVNDRGERIPRYDRYANQLRKTRNPRDLLFPNPPLSASIRR